jgi:hypothetical protein
MDYICVEDQIVQMFYQQVSLLPLATKLFLAPEMLVRAPPPRFLNTIVSDWNAVMHSGTFSNLRTVE